MDTEQATVNGNGTYTTPTGYVVTAAGHYQWTAIYNGNASDKNNNSATDNDPDEEKFTTPQAPTQISTLANPTGQITLGTTAVTLTDTATLTGGFNPGGSISFTLTYNGNPVAGFPTSVPVNGNGTYGPVSYTLPSNGTTVVGTYLWHAHYTPDANNSAADDNGSNESVTVNPASPTVVTTPNNTTIQLGGTATDSATLSGG